MMRDELLVMLPEFFKRVKEYPEIMEAYAYALSQADNNIRALWNNFYIQTCDEKTLSIYERLLGIIPSPSESLDSRRIVVLNKYSLIVPFSIGFLKSRLDAIYGDYDIEVDPVALTLKVTLNGQGWDVIDTVFDLIFDICPAHVEFELKTSDDIEIEDTIYAKSYASAYDKVFIPLDTTSRPNTTIYAKNFLGEYSKVHIESEEANDPD